MQEGLLGVMPNERQQRIMQDNWAPERSRQQQMSRHMSDIVAGQERFKLGGSMQLSMNLDMRDKALLEKVLQENTDDAIRRRLIEKYTKYYRYWVDFNILVAVLAGLGLGLALY